MRLSHILANILQKSAKYYIDLEDPSLSRWLFLTVDISDGKRDFSPQLFLVKFHPHDLVWEPLVEESVDLGSAGQLQGVDSGGSTTFDGTLKVLLQLLNAPEVDKWWTALTFLNSVSFPIKINKKTASDLLEHRLCFDRRIIGSEVFILLDLLLQWEVLLL